LTFKHVDQGQGYLKDKVMAICYWKGHVRRCEQSMPRNNKSTTNKEFSSDQLSFNTY